MKYYHIIYNSSEKPMEGGVGFGIRTATEGTPESLLKAIKGISFFSDDWETYEKKPTPAQMKENPSSIESIAKNYAVTTIADELGNVYSVIARRAYVGFDYGFYKNGMPTRPGNYVIDYYVFDQTPDSSAYEILYENAVEGSNHFIPKSVQPTETNEEMREISVGAQPPLPVSDKPFTATKADALDRDVVKLFFHYFQSKNTGKKLMVKASPEKALKLTADLYRMLSPEMAKSVRTYINLRNQGTNDNFDIFFIHADYPHQIYEGLYNYVEIDSSTMPSIDEAKTFASELEAYVSDSFSINKVDIDDTLRWLMLPEYQTVKLMSKQTIDSFFCYCIQPGNFIYDNLKDANGKELNEEFLKVLCTYVNKTPQNAERFNLIVSETMNEATPENVLALISDYNRMQAIGFKLDALTAEVNDHICKVLLSDIHLFKKALDTIGYNGLEKFFVKSTFEEHSAYVDTDVLDAYMLLLYKWFLPESELQAKDKMLYSRFFKRDMDSAVFYKIIDNVYGANVDNKTMFFRRVLQQGLKPVKSVWPYLEHYLNLASATPDFLTEFEAKISDGDYAPMFYYSIVKNKPLFADVAGVRRLTKVLERNPQLKKLIADNYNTDRLYDGFYRQIKQLCSTNPNAALADINNCVLKFLPGVKDVKLSILADYLTLVTTCDLNYSREFSGEKMQLLLQEIIDQNNSKLFNALLPQLLAMSKKGHIKPAKIAAQYRVYHPDAETIDVVNTLATPNNWIDMLAAVIYETDKIPFEEARLLCEDLKLKNNVAEELLNRCYAKEYNSWKRSQKVKRFFNTLKKLLFPQKKMSQPSGKNKPAKNDYSKDKPHR